MCHRGHCKAGWEFPDVTRPGLKVRERPIIFLTLHVRKTGRDETRKGSGETRKGSGETGKGSGETGSWKCYRVTGKQVRKAGPEDRTGKWDLKARQEGGVGEEDGKAMRFEGKV